MVTLPRSATIVPRLVAVPPPLTSTIKPAGSLLPAKYTVLPAANIVWPSGVLITPLFFISSANKTTLPPFAALICAPDSIIKLAGVAIAISPTALNTGLNVLSELIKPPLNSSSVISSVPAYIEPTLNCAFAPKIMPLVLIKYRLPLAFTLPFKMLGLKSCMRFNKLCPRSISTLKFWPLPKFKRL